MSAQTPDAKRFLAPAFLLMACLMGASGARAQAPELQGLPPGQFGTPNESLVSALDPVGGSLPGASRSMGLPAEQAATPRLDPATRKTASKTLPPSRPNPWMTALLAVAGLGAVVLAAVVLTLAVREMRREALERRRFRRRRVSRRTGDAPELDPRWLPRQRGLFDN
jgi:hypothetical protein